MRWVDSFLVLIFANFDFSGIVPREKDELAISAKGPEIVIRAIFISLGGISYESFALLSSRLAIISFTSCGVTGSRKKLCGFGLAR